MTHTLRSIGIGFIALAGIVGLSAVAAFSQKAEAASTVSSGDLIRGETFSAVYYMGEDGFRYVFPNDKTYFTWYSDFDDVKWITDVELGRIQIGGNVTYKPGVKMIKINTDPKVYVVDDGGALYAIGSEADATTLYGSNWNTKIDDVADAFFSNYTLTGEEVDASNWSASTVSAGAMNINEDKGLTAPEEISITDDGVEPLDVTISAGETVRFTNDGSSNHAATGDDGSWGTGTLEPGESYVVEFDEEGTYTFTDNYDESNTGAVYVE